ncbi:hypothetical protein [Roseimaritima sediminicola]|uniref:hypothetical protein n=1 Tax=Roseimaritima sediminicola TaxID=2662066 RepID=UPI0012982CF8|nr:hypothetical protein [Roseimaritima sediminicola]
MKSLCFSVCLALAASFLTGATAEAQSPAAYGPGYLGFYNPYSFPPSTSVRTPPYFSVHPPVYYSTRHARPYGMSPFAAPPMVQPASAYRGRQAADFDPKPLANPYCHSSTVLGEEAEMPTSPLDNADFAIGEVQQNPFAEPERVAVR